MPWQYNYVNILIFSFLVKRCILNQHIKMIEYYQNDTDF